MAGDAARARRARGCAAWRRGRSPRCRPPPGAARRPRAVWRSPPRGPSRHAVPVHGDRAVDLREHLGDAASRQLVEGEGVLVEPDVLPRGRQREQPVPGRQGVRQRLVHDGAGPAVRDADQRQGPRAAVTGFVSSCTSSAGPRSAAGTSSSAATARTVGFLNRSSTETRAPAALRSLAITCAASSEWPPRSKKSSSTPIRSTRSTSAQTAATVASEPGRGAVYCAVSSRPRCGAGSARRSSLPLGSSGSASRAVNAEGTM